MSTIINSSDQHQKAVNSVADAVVDNVYAPSGDGMLKLIGYGTSLIRKQDSLTQHSFKSIKDAKGVTGKIGAVMSNYDAAIAYAGDAVSRKTGAGAYYAVKQGLNLATLTVISRSRIGRILQETIATSVGLAVRLAGKVAEIALRALPYAGILAGIAFGGYFAQVGFVILYGITKIGFAATLIGSGSLGVFAGQQLQIHKLWKNVKNLREENEELKEEIEAANEPKELGFVDSLGKKVVDISESVNKHKGKIALGLAATGGAGAALYYFGIPAFAIVALDKIEAFFARVFSKEPKSV